MLHYILQVVAFQLFFLLAYDLFLKKETFFNWNRIYLLGTAVVSLIIPFIKIKSFTAITPEKFVVKLPQVVIGESQTSIDPAIADLAGITIDSQPIPLWQIIFYSGMFLTALIFITKIFRILIIATVNPKKWQGNLLIVKLAKSNSAFSFFNYVFLGENIRQEDRSSVLKHEKVHVNHFHTLDLLFFELMRIAFWFNPLAYMYQTRISILHEFIADEKAIKNQDKKAYYNQLLAQVFETKHLSIVNPFFKSSLIKKRIIMLNQSKSKNRNILNYALLIPLVAGMLFYVSCHKESLTEDDPSTFDLSQYSYSLRKGTTEMTKETKTIHEAYEQFLRSHPNYVSWAEINKERGIVSYSVHHIGEEVPEGFQELEVASEKNGNYVMYMNLDAPEEEYVTIDEVEVIDYDGELEVPFAVIDEVPTTKECANQFNSNEERKNCMSDFIAKHVDLNFDTLMASQLGLNGRQRINVIFKIDTDGNIVDIRSRAPHPGLEEEAIRVIKTLPQFIPGKHKGKPVIVPYSLPILFQINGNLSEVNNQEQEIIEQLSDIPFSVVDKSPSFPGCKYASDKAEIRKCTSTKIAEYINERFNIKLAKQNNLTGRQRINVIFKIDEQGNVIGIRARAAHPILEEEAIRVVSMLPRFTPGEQDGKPVVVPYSLPIIFNVE